MSWLSHSISLFPLFCCCTPFLPGSFYTTCSCAGFHDIYLNLMWFLFSYWRVQTSLHTVAQTLVGAACGSLCAILFIHNESLCQRSLRSLGLENKSNTHLSLDSSDIVIPLWWRLVVVCCGAIVLYKLEIKNALYKK